MAILPRTKWDRRPSRPPQREEGTPWWQNAWEQLPWEKWKREHPGEPWFKLGGREEYYPERDTEGRPVDIDPHALVTKEGKPYITMGDPLEEYEKYYKGGAKILSAPSRYTPPWEEKLQRTIWEAGGRRGQEPIAGMRPYKEWEPGWGTKGALELLGDPLVFIGGGGTKVPKATQAITKAIQQGSHRRFIINMLTKTTMAGKKFTLMEARKEITKAEELIAKQTAKQAKKVEGKVAPAIAKIDAEINRITKAMGYTGPERRTPKRIAEMHQTRDMLIAEKARRAKGIAEPMVAPKAMPMAKPGTSRAVVEAAEAIPPRVPPTKPPARPPVTPPPSEAAPPELLERMKAARQTILKQLTTAKTKEKRRILQRDLKRLDDEIAKATTPTPPPTGGDIVARLTAAIEEAKPLKAMTEAEKALEVRRRVGKAAAMAKGKRGKEAMFARLGAMKGEYAGAEFTPVGGKFAASDIDALHNMVNDSALRELEKMNAGGALEKVLQGKVPQEHEFELLSRVFGEELIEAIAKHIKRGTWETALDVLGIPRALQTMLDLSHVLRQGAIAFWRHPVRGIENTWLSAKSFVKEVNAKTLDEATRANQYYNLTQSLTLSEGKRLYLPHWGGRVRVAKREEAYMSRFAQWVPGLRQSERAFISGLNKMRMDMAADYFKMLEKRGIELTDDVVGPICEYINIATGRGNIGRLNSIAPALNQIFYSARLQISRLEIPYVIAKLPAPVRKAAIGDMVKFFAANASLVGIGVAAGGRIELDPRSSDFGKLKIGNTRLDPWAGWAQWVRFLSQMVTGTRKIVATGGKKAINRLDLAYTFILRYKASPQFGLLQDLLAGQTVIGEEMEPTWEGLKVQARNRLLSFTIMDFWDAFEQEGLVGFGLATPAIFGWGMVSYPNPLNEREKLIGQIDPDDEEGGTYGLSTFMGDIHRMGYVSGEEGSKLVNFMFSCEDTWQGYYDTPPDRRYDYRAEHPRTDAMLFFWGKVTTLQSKQAEKHVHQWMEQYGVNAAVIKGYNKPRTIPRKLTPMIPYRPKSRPSSERSGRELLPILK